MEETVEELKSEIAKLKRQNEYLEAQSSRYENGDAKLYYSLQRKMTEMSKVFNSQDLSTIDMGSKADATFDRIFKLLEKCEVISKSVESLGTIAGVTGNEEKDISSKKQRTSPESIANVLGNTAGQQD